ncbi:hypothetical protein D3C84_903090 [compost metagenome]
MLCTSGSLIVPSQVDGAEIFVPVGIAKFTLPSAVVAVTATFGNVATKFKPSAAGVTCKLTFVTPAGTVILTGTFVMEIDSSVLAERVARGNTSNVLASWNKPYVAVMTVEPKPTGRITPRESIVATLGMELV